MRVPILSSLPLYPHPLIIIQRFPHNSTIILISKSILGINHDSDGNPNQSIFLYTLDYTRVELSTELVPLELELQLHPFIDVVSYTYQKKMP
jgi:hypothetical protein